MKIISELLSFSFCFFLFLLTSHHGLLFSEETSHRIAANRFGLELSQFVADSNYALNAQIGPPVDKEELFTFVRWIKKLGVLDSSRPSALRYLDSVFGNVLFYQSHIQDGDIVWLFDRGFKSFVEKVLPKIEKNIILIYQGDPTFPDELDVNIESVLENQKIIHVFAVNNNYRGKSAKVSSLPLGIHIEPYTGLGVQNLLRKIQKQAPNNKERDLRIVGDFVLTNSSHHRLKALGEDRKTIASFLLNQGVMNALAARIPVSELWKMKSFHAFDASPFGEGYDCYRTWEGLLLGQIVIVKTSFLDPLFDGMPVKIVKEWHEVTLENLKKWHVEFQPILEKGEYRRKLTHRYWWSKVREKREAYLGAR